MKYSKYVATYEPRTITIPYFNGNLTIPDGTVAKFIVIHKDKPPGGDPIHNLLDIREFLPFSECWFMVTRPMQSMIPQRYWHAGRIVKQIYWWEGRTQGSEIGFSGQFPYEDLDKKIEERELMLQKYEFTDSFESGNLEIFNFDPKIKKFNNPIIWLENSITNNFTNGQQSDFSILREVLKTGNFLAVMPSSTVSNRPEGWVMFYRMVAEYPSAFILRAARPYDENISLDEEHSLWTRHIIRAKEKGILSVPKFWNQKYPDFKVGPTS
jgi:hypothetical protein